MKIKLKSSYESFLPFLIIWVSLINIANNRFHPVSLSVILSYAGLAGSVLYFINPVLFIRILYAWVVLQIVILKPWFDLSQIANLSFGFGFVTRSGEEGGLYINVLPLLLLGILKTTQLASLKGKKLTFYEFRESALGNIFPFTGTITGQWKFADDDRYAIVKPDTSITYDGEPVHHILVKRKDDKPLKPNGEKQLVYFRPVHKESGPVGTDVDDYPFVDWVYAGK